MKKIFIENDYSFTDSIITEVKLDVQNICDYLIGVDYFLGRKESTSLVIRLKNVKVLNVSINKKIETDLISMHTLAHISKIKKGDFMEFIIESHLTFLPEHKDDVPLVYCLCEEVYIEAGKSLK